MFRYLLLIKTEREWKFFKLIYKEHRNEMFYRAYKILRNKADAEDIVQESFVSLIEHLDELMESEPHKTWYYIMKTVRNQSYNLIKKRKRLVENELEENFEDIFEKNMEMMIEEAEQESSITELLKSLKPSYREVLLMQYYYEMSVKEIAEHLGKTQDNIRHISARARKKLKAMLEEKGILKKEE